MFKALHDRLGIERAVIVNATPHGRDNRVVTDAIAQSGGRYKGVANVDESFSDRDLQHLAEAGITGCRFTFLPRLGKLPDMSSFDRIVERIAALDWHVDLYLPATLLSDFRPRLTALPVPYVLDHMGVVDVGQGPGSACLRRLARSPARGREMLGEGHVSGTHVADRAALPRCRALRPRPDRGGAGPRSLGNGLAASERAGHAG